MKAELKRKTTRTVHGKKVVRLRLDIPYEEARSVEDCGQDMLKWFDANVDSNISAKLGPFEDDNQKGLGDKYYPDDDEVRVDR